MVSIKIRGSLFTLNDKSTAKKVHSLLSARGADSRTAHSSVRESLPRTGDLLAVLLSFHVTNEPRIFIETTTLRMLDGLVLGSIPPTPSPLVSNGILPTCGPVTTAVGVTLKITVY